MDRRDLLRGLLAMPIASTLGAGQHKAKGSSYPPRPAASGKLSVVVYGAFAIVVQKDRGSRIRIFTPREENDKHQFYFFDDPKRRDHKGPLRPQPTNRVYNFELSSEGLRTQTEPEIDTGLASFNVRTDEWCQKDYFVTIDLPVPKRITFTPPPAPVKFRHHDRHGCMPVNHVLEYDVTDQSKVRMMLGEDLIGPTPCAELIRRYQDECRKHGEERPGSSRTGEDHKRGECSDVPKEYASTCPESGWTFFFGVGLLASPHDEEERKEHAIRFFNKQILKSFPGLQERLEIEKLGRRGEPCKNETYSSQATLAPAILRPGLLGEPRLLEASHIIDCQLTGPVVNFPS